MNETVIDKKTKEAIWDTLVSDGGANDGLRDQFLQIWPDCVEFRFQGRFGFGGKIYYDRYNQSIRISAYREDVNLTPGMAKELLTLQASINDIVKKNG